MFDPRDYDSRDRNESSRDLGRGGRAPGDGRERDSEDPRDVFMRDLDLPLGHDREHVYDPDRHYTLRESESRTCRLSARFGSSRLATCAIMTAGLLILVAAKRITRTC